MKITFRKLKSMLEKQGHHLVFNEHIVLNMTELPVGIQSITVNNGSLESTKLTTLPDGITIKADVFVFLKNLTTMGNNVMIEAGWSILLNCLTAIGDNVTIKTGWNVEFENLTTIGNNVTIKAKYGIMFTNTNTGIKEITLTNNEPIHTEVVQFLTDKNITVRCSGTSPLVNLSFDGVKVEIVA